MSPYDCCTLVREYYNQIGSGTVGYAANAINACLTSLNEIAQDEKLPLESRQKAALACANLLISDHKD